MPSARHKKMEIQVGSQMDVSVIQKALAQEKRMYAQLNTALDLTKQLAEAVDRGDQVAMQLVLSMRAEPLDKLCMVRSALEEQCNTLPTPDAERLTELLNGGETQQDEETPLVQQTAMNHRLLQQLLELDKVINQKLGRDKSLYAKKPDTNPKSG